MSRVGPENVPGGSRKCPGQVPKMSRAGPENVPGGSRKCLGRVPKMSRAGSDRVPAGSGDVLAVVYQFENVTLKLEKWFTVLKRGNHFTKIKEDFSVKLQ
jgi:hypothetical protein